MTNKPTDAELIAFAVETGMRVRTGKGVVTFARAVLARWGQPAQAAGPVAWAFKYDDGTWHDPSTTEHSSGMRPLFAAPQPAHSGVHVAWLSPWRADQVTTDYDAYGEHGIPLYTAPQPVEREPLTDAQIEDLLICGNPTDEEKRLIRMGWDAAHGIKGGQHGTK